MSNEIDKNITEKWVNLEDIAEYLSVSKDTVRTWMREGKLPVNCGALRCSGGLHIVELACCSNWKFAT